MAPCSGVNRPVSTSVACSVRVITGSSTVGQEMSRVVGAGHGVAAEQRLGHAHLRRQHAELGVGRHPDDVRVALGEEAHVVAVAHLHLVADGVAVERSGAHLADDGELRRAEVLVAELAEEHRRGRPAGSGHPAGTPSDRRRLRLGRGDQRRALHRHGHLRPEPGVLAARRRSSSWWSRRASCRPVRRPVSAGGHGHGRAGDDAGRGVAARRRARPARPRRSTSRRAPRTAAITLLRPTRPAGGSGECRVSDRRTSGRASAGTRPSPRGCRR